MGSLILTQWPSSLAAPLLEGTASNITSLYKAVPGPARRSPKGVSDWDVVFESPEAVAIGEVVPYTIHLINSSALPKSMRINLTISAIDYTGSTLTNLAPHVSTDVEVPPGKIQELTLTLALADYVVACAASQLLEARLSVVEFSQLGAVVLERRTGLARPSNSLHVAQVHFTPVRSSLWALLGRTNWVSFCQRPPSA